MSCPYATFTNFLAEAKYFLGLAPAWFMPAHENSLQQLLDLNTAINGSKISEYSTRTVRGTRKIDTIADANPPNIAHGLLRDMAYKLGKTVNFKTLPAEALTAFETYQKLHITDQKIYQNLKLLFEEKHGKGMLDPTFKGHCPFSQQNEHIETRAKLYTDLDVVDDYKAHEGAMGLGINNLVNSLNNVTNFQITHNGKTALLTNYPVNGDQYSLLSSLFLIKQMSQSSYGPRTSKAIHDYNSSHETGIDTLKPLLTAFVENEYNNDLSIFNNITSTAICTLPIKILAANSNTDLAAKYNTILKFCNLDTPEKRVAARHVLAAKIAAEIAPSEPETKAPKRCPIMH